MTSFFASSSFTLLHVILSLIGIAAGFVVIAAMIGNRRLGIANTVFLVTTVATSVTGFLFPFKGFTPGIGVGIVSIIALCAALLAFYGGKLTGLSRPAFTISATLALYLNVFVLIVQAFQKIPFLGGADPAHPPLSFVIVQALALIDFCVLGFIATKRFHQLA